MNKEELKKIFTDYVFKNYDMKDEGISRKYYHSLRVMEIADLIAINENFSQNDIELANIIGLLHDYARFSQWKKYNTYSDLNSVDHGDLGTDLLFYDNEIEKFNIKHNDYDEIFDAIKYHNKLEIKDDISLHNELLCKLIRDADKLDIFYLFGEDMSLLEEDNNDISEAIRKDFYDHKQISRKKVLSKSDDIILNLAMIFDLNFKYSYKYLKDNNLIEKIFKRINDKEKYKEYFDYVIKYINERTE